MDNSIEQEGNNRIDSAAVRRATQRTASSSVSSVAGASQSQQITDKQLAAQEITDRTTTQAASESSIVTGRLRYRKEDQNNLTTNVTIADAARKIVETEATESQQTVDLTTSVTPQDRVTTLQSKTFASKQSQADATRALQKLQSRCNHKYNVSTRNCEFCGKSRDSHLYDIG